MEAHGYFSVETLVAKEHVFVIYGSDDNITKDINLKNYGNMWPIALMSMQKRNRRRKKVEEEKEKNMTNLAKYHGHY